VRITAQLIEVDTDSHLWSETYDRELKDVFAIQDDIARSIVAALEVTLTFGAYALVEQGQPDRAREWSERALDANRDEPAIMYY